MQTADRNNDLMVGVASVASDSFLSKTEIVLLAYLPYHHFAII